MFKVALEFAGFLAFVLLRSSMLPVGGGILLWKAWTGDAHAWLPFGDPLMWRAAVGALGAALVIAGGVMLGVESSDLTKLRTPVRISADRERGDRRIVNSRIGPS